MATYGKDYFIKLADPNASGGFIDIGGFRTNDISFRADTVDITDKSSNDFRELLDETGQISLEISGDGIFHSKTALTRVLNLHLNRRIARWRILITDLGRIDVDAAITALSLRGRIEEDRTYQLTLSSSGPFDLQDEDDQT